MKSKIHSQSSLCGVVALSGLLSLSACGGGSTPSNDIVKSDEQVAVDANVSAEDHLVASATTPSLIVRAREDITVMTGEQFDAAAYITLNSTPTHLPVFEWRATDANADVFFELPSKARTSVIINTEGTFELKMLAKVGEIEGNDSMMVTVVDPIINQAPKVNAGNSLTIPFDTSHKLNATATDDGLPASSLSTQWSFSSNDGNVTFNDTADLKTQVTFDSAGVYTLTLTGDDGELQDTDSMTITVKAPVVVVTAPDPDTSASGVSANQQWANVLTANGSKPQARHEAGSVALNGDLFLLGGRGSRVVNRYDPSQNKWSKEGNDTTNFSHFQPVTYGGKIYAVGGLTCCYPSEDVTTHVQIFNPSSKSWSQGHKIPSNRRRGGGGAVNYKNKIYMVGGNTNGHDGGTVDWFDEYNPANNTWKTLKSLPHKRDHVNAVIVGDRLVVTGGRKTDHPNVFSDLVRETDVYNFKTGEWETNHPDIPTPTAGAMVVAVGNEAVVIGGEIGSSASALKTVQAYNVVTRKWRTLKSLKTGRHSGGAVVVDNAIHAVSGNTTRGGGSETQSHEKLELD